MSMEGLRQGAQNIGSGKGKGGTRPSYYARWKPSAMNDTLKRFLAAPPSEESLLGIAEPIVIIPGQYPDTLARNPDGSAPNPPPTGEAHRFRAHTFAIFVKPKNPGQQGFKSFREIVCSAGPEPHAPQPCVGCHQVDHGVDGKPRDNWAFNIAHLNWYHQQPLMKDGQIQTKKGSNEPIMTKNECLSYKMENVLYGRAAQANAQNVKKPKPCDGCGGQHPFIFGDHRVLQVGFGHLKNLFATDEELGKRCMNCNTFMLRLAFHCGNENCDAEVVQIAQTGWTNDQIDQFSKSAHQCGHCGYAGLPYSKYKCGYNEQYAPTGGGCPPEVDPRKMSIFDCVLWLQREGEKTDSEIVVKKLEPIDTYRTQDGRPLREHLAEIVKQPYNLAEMYAPDTLDEQAKTLSIQNPYAAQQPAYQPYGAMPGAPGGMMPPGAPMAPPGYGPPGMPPQQQMGYGPPPGVPQQPQPGYAPPGQQQPQQPPFPGPTPGRPNYGK